MLLKENNQLHDDRFPIAAQRGVFQKKFFKMLFTARFYTGKSCRD